ncbi:MAG TPA: SPOR domain-containing protein [Lamprocystis sp. (in: g-proteobacteria)]|nr:SPOR domain-containing protein [Lamprocystis sp. (in: g-proteobacteria)]
MAETPGTGHTDDLDAPDLPLARRLRALEGTYAELQSGQSGAARRPAVEASPLEALAAELAAYRTQTRDLEKSLVERIADVDDDRRLTTAQIQRAWQAQREESEAGQRRGFWLAALALALLLILGVGAVIGLYAHSQAELAALAQQIERLNGGQQRLTAELESRRRAPELLATIVPTKSTSAPSAPAAAPAAPITPAVGAPAETEDAVTPAKIAQAAALLLVDEPRVPAAQTAPTPAAAPTTDVAQDSQPQTITVTNRPFAIQLNGSHSQENIRKLAARPNLPAQVYMRAEVRRGRPWYVLIHSLHGSIEEARKTLAQLPSELRGRSPWIRALPPGANLDIIATRGFAP